MDSWVENILTIPFFLTPPVQKEKIVDVNLQKRSFAGIQFVIWTGGFWIKNNGANFFAELKPITPTEKVVFIFFFNIFMLTILGIAPHVPLFTRIFLLLAKVISACP